MVGHKKYKSNRGDEQDEGGEEEKVGVKSEKEVGKPVEAMLWLHRYEVCYKTLPTGQSLVGHMRCHRVIPSSTYASAEEAATGRPVIIDFDLNELPAFPGWIICRRKETTNFTVAPLNDFKVVLS